MTRPNAPHPIDWDKIDFPSGRVTVKTLCRVEQLLVDPNCGSDRTFWTFALNDMLCAERLLAVDAISRASLAGKTPLLQTEERQSLLASLEQRYREFGVADGPAATRELIRHLEASAVAAVRSGRNR